ncbi:host attachment protein [Halobacteriovorax sp. ZH4_bin.1]|uniref:host attachment protein n=1 Tax=unclassified Halobacteriovorax TaxID=2639665 RepID=UPI00371158CD
MHRSWVVVASKSNARIYERKKRNTLKLIKSLENPKVKLKEGEVDSDRHGSMANSNGHGYQSFTPKKTNKKHREELFAKEINQFLNHNHNKNNFDDLVIVAENSFLGVIRNNLNSNLNKHVSNYLNKDLGNLPDSEIEKIMAA